MEQNRMSCKSTLKWTVLLSLHVSISTQTLGIGPKRGLSGISGCNDAQVFGLQDSWHYNWGVWPTQIDGGGNTAAKGVQFCEGEKYSRVFTSCCVLF